MTGFDGPYDGKGHGISVTVDPGIASATVRYALAEDGEYGAENPLFTDVGERAVWCEVSAPGYVTQTNSARVVIRKASVPGGGGGEGGDEPDVPGEGEGGVPEGGLSKFDALAVYDGEGDIRLTRTGSSRRSRRR